jgi:hypothetical protein
MRYLGGLLLCAIGLCLLVVAGPALPQHGPPEFTPPGLKRAAEVHERHHGALFRVKGVVATGAGIADEDDETPVVAVFTDEEDVGPLPKTLDGIRVKVHATGHFHAIAKGTASATAATSRFPRPVPIGVSTGNWNECSAGTISARVSNGNVYALSNNHVYARENRAAPGEQILQPGRYDTNCARSANDVIGTLTSYEPIVFTSTANNKIDAAIALSGLDKLGNATPSDGYGLPKARLASDPLLVNTLIGKAVQKYGRTSILTKGTITAVNAKVLVGYGSGTALFVDQIIVQSKKAFIKAGDSGSLLVTDPGRVPVGLLFAGDSSGKYAVANRIDLVLGRFGVNLDGE